VIPKSITWPGSVSWSKPACPFPYGTIIKSKLAGYDERHMVIGLRKANRYSDEMVVESIAITNPEPVFVLHRLDNFNRPLGGRLMGTRKYPGIRTLALMAGVLVCLGATALVRIVHAPAGAANGGAGLRVHQYGVRRSCGSCGRVDDPDEAVAPRQTRTPAIRASVLMPGYFRVPINLPPRGR